MKWNESMESLKLEIKKRRPWVDQVGREGAGRGHYYDPKFALWNMWIFFYYFVQFFTWVLYYLISNVDSWKTGLLQHCSVTWMVCKPLNTERIRRNFLGNFQFSIFKAIDKTLGKVKTNPKHKGSASRRQQPHRKCSLRDQPWEKNKSKSLISMLNSQDMQANATVVFLSLKTWNAHAHTATTTEARHMMKVSLLGDAHLLTTVVTLLHELLAPWASRSK